MINGTHYGLVAAVALIAGFGGGVMAGRLPLNQQSLISQPAKVIRAEAFQLVDRHGATHASLDIQEGGGPGLLFYDSAHHTRVILDMTGTGDPRLFLIDGDGTIRAVLGLGFGADGLPFMRLSDEKRQVIWSVP